MIQPLKSGRTRWVLDWFELDEPFRRHGQWFLPTCVYAVTGSGRSLVGYELLQEMDQRRLEWWQMFRSCYPYFPAPVKTSPLRSRF